MLIDKLKNEPKERTENIMIVDLSSKRFKQNSN